MPTLLLSGNYGRKTEGHDATRNEEVNTKGMKVWRVQKDERQIMTEVEWNEHI